MYFSMLKLVDKSDCSFEIPDFQTADDEQEWQHTLTIDQGFELMNLLNEARWGKFAKRGPMDRRRLQILTWDEFITVKDAEDVKVQAWLAAKREDYFAKQRGGSDVR